MSDLQIRNLANACADRLSATVEQAVVRVVKEHLPETIAAVLREQYPGETLRLYVPKRSVSLRRDRDAALRSQYTGHNIHELAARFGVSISHAYRIVKIR